MVRGSQILLEGLGSMMQDGLAGREEVVMTFTFLPYGLFLKFLHKPYMFPMQYSGLSRFHSPGLAKSPRIGSFGFLEPIAPDCFGFLDSCPVVAFGLQNHLGIKDCLGTVHLGVKDLSGTDYFGFFDGRSLFGFILAQQ